MRDPREKPPDHPQAELGLSYMSSELGSNPQQWDEERFRLASLTHAPPKASFGRELKIFFA